MEFLVVRKIYEAKHLGIVSEDILHLTTVELAITNSNCARRCRQGWIGVGVSQGGNILTIYEGYSSLL